MNKKFLFNTFLLAGAVMFAACDYNEDNFDGLSDGAVPTDVKKVEYTMTADDYKAVSKNKTNVTIAADTLKKALENVGKHAAFSNAAPADKFMPAFLAQKYFTADNGSAVKVTYEKDLDWSEEMKQLNSASAYKVSNANYESIWEKPVYFFSPMEKPSKHIPAILAEEYADGVNGEMVFVDYMMSDSEPAGEVVPVLNQSFDDDWNGEMEPLDIPGWLNVTTQGEKSWNGKSHDGNNFVEIKAFKAAGEVESYLIAPAFKAEEGMDFSFSACYTHNFNKGTDYLHVFLLATNDDLSTYSAEQIAAAKWTDISDTLNIPIPNENFGNLVKVYEKDLSEFAGKRVYVAFRYNGNGATKATATVRLDDIVITGGAAEEVVNILTPQTVVYQLNDGNWKEYNDAYAMTKADYNEIGSKFDSFSSSFKADNYLPTFLANKYPYAQEGDKETIVYKYYSNKKTSVRADEYVVIDGTWTKAPKTETLTDQFVLNNGKWSYDPSCVITLLPIKGDAYAASYYQAATDWVWNNIDVPAGASKPGEGFVSSYGNNEYYSGCSAFYNNVDMRVDKAREQNAKAYEGMTDEQVVETMEKNLIEVMKGALETLHADVAPIEGIDVIFTIKMGVFIGVQLTDCNYEMKYKVVGPGTFEYIEDSYQPIAK